MKTHQISQFATYSDEEYFCWDCGQLKLSATGMPVYRCRNCGSTNLKVGQLVFLDKDQLKSEFREDKENEQGL